MGLKFKAGLDAAIKQCDRLGRYVNDPKLFEHEPGGAIRGPQFVSGWVVYIRKAILPVL